MRQNKESSTGLTAEGQRRAEMSRPQNTAGSFGRYSEQAREGHLSAGALNAVPLLCLNTWQHMWIPDYGITGKRTYLAAWWERIDWDVVYQRYTRAGTLGGGGSGYPYRR